MRPTRTYHIVSLEFCPGVCGVPIKRTLVLSMDVDQFLMRNLFNRDIQNLVLLGVVPCCEKVYRELLPKNPGPDEYLMMANADYRPLSHGEEDGDDEETF